MVTVVEGCVPAGISIVLFPTIGSVMSLVVPSTASTRLISRS